MAILSLSGNAVSLSSTTASVIFKLGTNPSLPTGNLPGWTQVFATDYDVDVPQDGAGSVEVSYPGHKLFNAFVDTSHNGTYDKTSRTTFVINSALTLYLHYDGSTAKWYVSCVLPMGYTGQQYGKWTWRMSAPSGPNVAEYKIVPLLWPASDVYGQGEIDYPENVIGSSGNIQINPHTALGSARAGEGNGTTIAGQTVIPYHTYEVAWTSASMTMSLDGVVYRTLLPASVAWPPGPMRFELQAETANLTVNSPPPAITSTGAVYVDWVAIYTPSTAPNDTFTGADSATSLGLADSGETWTSAVATFGISGNQAYLAGGTGGAAVIPYTQADQYVSVSIPVLPALATVYLGVVARYTDESNYYWCDVSSTTVRLWSKVAGVNTSIYAQQYAFTPGSKLGLKIVGTRLSIMIDDVALASVTNTALTTSTSVGIRASAATSVGRLDNFIVDVATGSSTLSGGAASLSLTTGTLIGTTSAIVSGGGLTAAAATLAGSAQSNSVTTATLTQTLTLSGSASSTSSTFAASLVRTTGLAGSVQSTSSTSATAVLAAVLAGSVLSTTSTSGALTQLGVLAGAAQSISSTAATLVDVSTLSGASASVSATSGTMSQTGVLTGTAVSTSATAGLISQSGVWSGAAQSISATQASMVQAQVLTSSALSVSSTTASIAAARSIGGGATSTSVSTASMTMNELVVGAAQSISATTAALGTGFALTGSAISTSSTAATIAARSIMSAAALSTSSTTAAAMGVTSQPPLIGTALSASVTSGALTTSLSLTSAANSTSLTTATVTADSPLDAMAISNSMTAADLTLTGEMTGSSVSGSFITAKIVIEAVLVGAQALSLSVTSGSIAGVADRGGTTYRRIGGAWVTGFTHYRRVNGVWQPHVRHRLIGGKWIPFT